MEPESARGMMEDQWKDLSDSEEELEALELLTRAEEGLMMEYNMMKSGLAKKTPGKKQEAQSSLLEENHHPRKILRHHHPARG